MTLTEEQRAALKRVAAYMDEMYSVASPYHGCTEDSDLLRAMIDSSGTVEPTGGFDLEAARAALVGALKPGGYHDQETARIIHMHMPSLLAEIERLRAENEEALESLTAAYLLGRHEKAQEVAARPKEGKIDSSEHVTEPTKMIGFDLEAARAGIAHYRIENPSNVDTESHLKDLVDQANLAEEYLAEIERLRADLEQSEEIKRLKDELENYGDHYACLLISKDAQIKELEGMLSIRTEELDIAHSVARSEKEMHEKELAAFARRIKELEDALVEERAGVITSHPLTHVIDEDRTEASMQLQAEGKIGNSEHFTDASKMIWQITEERVGLLEYCLETLLDAPDIEEIPGPGHSIEVLRDMLKEAGQE